MSDGQVSNYLCIGCPLGCRLEVEEGKAGDIVEIRGFTCKRGKTYGEQEHTDPKRMVTTTVAVNGGLWERLPVKTASEVPKGQVEAVCAALREISLQAPVKIGTVVLADVLGSGVDIVASRDIPAAG